MSIRLNLIAIIFLMYLFVQPLYCQFRFLKSNEQVIGFSVSRLDQQYIDSIKDGLPNSSKWIRYTNSKYGISCLLPPGFKLDEIRTISDSSLVIRHTLHNQLGQSSIKIKLTNKSFYSSATSSAFGINDGNNDIINEINDSSFFANPELLGKLVSLGRHGQQARAIYFEYQDLKCIRGDNVIGKYGEYYEGLEFIKYAFATKRYSDKMSLAFFYESIESEPNPLKEYRFYQIISFIELLKK